jgi:hypothetical protein
LNSKKKWKKLLLINKSKKQKFKVQYNILLR